mgnify:CR=1 FL=1
MPPHVYSTQAGRSTKAKDPFSFDAFKTSLNATGLTDLSGYRRRYFTEGPDGNLASTRESYSSNYARQQALTRRERRSVDLLTFQQESEDFNLAFGSSQSAREALDTQFNQTNTEISEVLSGMADAPDKASSIGQYSKLAQKSMQDTQKAIADLDAFKAPQAVELVSSFVDPFTGKKVGLDSKFEDFYTETDPTSMANRMVNEEFKDTRASIYKDLRSNIEADPLKDRYDAARGFDMDKTYHQANPNANKQARNQAAHYAGIINMYDSGGPSLDEVMKGMKDYDKATANLDRYASAATLAKMAGANKMDSFTGDFGEEMYINPTEYYLNADVNAELASMKDKTATRLDIERLNDRASFSKEFDARKQRAQSQAGQAEQNDKINKIRQQQIVDQKNQLQQRLQRQQAEYGSTLAGFGTGDSSDTGVQFTDTRPS